MKKKTLTNLIVLGILFVYLVLASVGCSHSTAAQPDHSDFYPSGKCQNP